MCATGSTASIVRHEAGVVPTLQWLHLKQLQFRDKIFQRDAA